jgi:hypothetical protein
MVLKMIVPPLTRYVPVNSWIADCGLSVKRNSARNAMLYLYARTSACAQAAHACVEQPCAWRQRAWRAARLVDSHASARPMSGSERGYMHTCTCAPHAATLRLEPSS